MSFFSPEYPETFNLIEEDGKIKRVAYCTRKMVGCARFMARDRTLKGEKLKLRYNVY